MSSSQVFLTLYRGEQPAVGVCGAKGCQASTQSTESLGCSSRFGSTDDDAEEGEPVAIAWTDRCVTATQSINK